jgi:hypothetical protein
VGSSAPSRTFPSVRVEALTTVHKEIRTSSGEEAT